MSRKKPNKQWLQKQNADVYVKQARQSHYRSRAVYKLEDIDKKDRLIRQGSCIVDLGAAPGSWSQYATEKSGTDGRVIAVDILPMEPVPGVIFVQGDFTEEATEKSLLQHIDKKGVDLVMSDMAPNLTGIRSTDQVRSLVLAELALNLCKNVLKPGGDLLIKVFEGAGTSEYRQQLREHFKHVLTRKPGASRDKSREYYVLARSYEL